MTARKIRGARPAGTKPGRRGADSIGNHAYIKAMARTSKLTTSKPQTSGLEKLRPIRRHGVASSAVASIGYDRPRRLLDVEYVSGIVYRYFGVETRVVAALLRASSIGQFVNRRIRLSYPYRRLD